MTDAPLTIAVIGPRTPLRTKWLTMLRDLVGSVEPAERPQILDGAPGHAESVREFHIHQAARPCLCGSPSCPQGPARGERKPHD